ncbi:hypothetical protein GCM10010350_68980 [Streptomyces galilaeus]|nr:hypothetical protein GCM10010350_68980 [Streptomyces galilaeus]
MPRAARVAADKPWGAGSPLAHRVLPAGGRLGGGEGGPRSSDPSPPFDRAQGVVSGRASRFVRARGDVRAAGGSASGRWTAGQLESRPAERPSVASSYVDGGHRQCGVSQRLVHRFQIQGHREPSAHW